MKTLLVPRSRGIRSCLARFRADRSGNIAILFAVVATVLMVGIGAAIDIGRWLHARDQTVAAMDSAVLAGGRILQTDSTNTSGAIAAATNFYEENVTSRLPVVDDSVTFGVADDGSAMTANGTAYIKTPFLKFANIDRLQLINLSETRAERKIGNKEVSLMLDVTGSMAGQKLQDLKDAAKDLVSIVLPGGPSQSAKLALVPFSEDIRLPTTSALDKARGTSLPSQKTITTGWGWNAQQKTYYLSDCVVERTGSQKYTDAAPGSGKYVMGRYTEDYTTSGGGGGWWGGGGGGTRKGKCTIPSDSEIVPLSSDANTLKSKIDNLSAEGGTAGHLGTAWAWYTLSPDWASLWPSESQPQPYGTQDLKKIAILMTDGEYNRQYDANGISSSNGANGSSTEQARALCSAMKQKDIEIYTIGFDLGGSNSASYQTLQQCASASEKFYPVASGDQLKQAFHDIGLKLSKLYLSK
jgi:Flp pilus assembly protein TadG